MEWYLLALLSAIIFGVSDVIKKKILSREHTLQFTSTYYLIIFIFLLVLLPRVDFYLSPAQWALIGLKSCFLAVAAFIILKLLRHYDISEVEPLKNLSPLFLLVFGFIILNETPNIFNISGILLLLLGAYVMEADHKIIHLKKPLKVLKEKKLVLLLIYLVFISFCAIIDKIVVRTVDIYSYYFLQILLIAIIFISLKYRKEGGLMDIRLALRRDWLGFIVACALVVVSDLFFLKAISVPAALIVLVVPIRRLSTLVSAFIGGEIFHEKALKLKLTACVIMLAGAYMVIL
ncbi:MAG: DMT family transporter [Candidatus Woesearchaeota archaeon]